MYTIVSPALGHYCTCNKCHKTPAETFLRTRKFSDFRQFFSDHLPYSKKFLHCYFKCRLAKIRGLMCGGKYSAVIGRETRFFAYVPGINMQVMIFFANHSAVFSPVHQTTDFRQTTCDSV